MSRLRAPRAFAATLIEVALANAVRRRAPGVKAAFGHLALQVRHLRPAQPLNA